MSSSLAANLIWLPQIAQVPGAGLPTGIILKMPGPHPPSPISAQTVPATPQIHDRERGSFNVLVRHWAEVVEYRVEQLNAKLPSRDSAGVIQG